MKRALQRFVRLTRAPFFTAVIIPALLGGAIAWQEGSLHLGYLLLTLIGITAIHGGLNMSNDYFDHLSSNDAHNLTPTPFSGGSRVIQEGIATPRQVRNMSLVLYGVGIAIGLYLTATRGWAILAIGIVGMMLAVFHNAPPIRIYHIAPGMGELATGIGFGPVTVLGSYYVQTQRFALAPVLASLPVAFLIAAILLANEFPDTEADRRVGKKTLPVSMGKRRATWAYAAIVLAAYVSLILGIIVGIIPALALIALVTLPLGYRAIQGVRQHYDSVPEIIPALATTVQLHLTTGLLLCLGYLASRFIS